MVSQTRLILSGCLSIRWIIVALLLAGSAFSAKAGNKCQLIDRTSKTSFKVLDSLLHARKPNLSAYCIERLNIVYARAYWPKGTKNTGGALPPKARVLLTARRAARADALTVIDIEHWPIKGHAALIESSVRKYLTVLTWFKKAAPNVRVGYYGVVPIRDYWRAVKNSAHPEHVSWQAENDKIKAVADEVDAVFPSLYTFYADQNGWQLYAAAQIKEARRLAPGKKVYPFLWPKYHNSNRLLRRQYLPREYWRTQLELVRNQADGVVIWGGYKKTWDSNMPWWRETKQFIASRFQKKLLN